MTSDLHMSSCSRKSYNVMGDLEEKSTFTEVYACERWIKNTTKAHIEGLQSWRVRREELLK